MLPSEDLHAVAAATGSPSAGLAARGGAEGGAEQDVGMGHLLTFSDPGLEREFVDSMNRVWARNDSVAVIAALLITARAVLEGGFASKVGIACHISLLCVGVMSYGMLLRYPNRYRGWRLNGWCWLKPIICIIHSVSIQHRDASQIWGAETLPFLMMKISLQTALPLMYTAVGGQLPFSNHILVIFLCLPSLWGWIASLQAACIMNVKVRSIVGTLGWKTEILMTTISLLGFPANIESLTKEEYTCPQVGFFYGILLGLLVPTLIVYIRECNSRIAFMKARTSDQQAGKWNELKLERLTLAAICFLVCSQTTWFTTRLIVGTEEVTEGC